MNTDRSLMRRSGCLCKFGFVTRALTAIFQRSTLTLVVGAGWVVGSCFENARAQAPTVPFADPTKMFDQMFGEDSEEDRRALQKIDVSIDDERKLGEQLLQGAMASLKDQGIEVETKGRDVDYLQSLVETLKPFMQNKNRYKSIRVIVAKSSRIDARSYPGGTLIFFDGLLDAADSEAALVTIVGHELSHLDRGHQLLPIKRIKLMEKSFSSTQNLMDMFRNQQVMTKLWARPFRPEDERDADRDGVAWAFAAGYDPRELVKLFSKISEQSAKGSAGEAMPWNNFLKSHPYNHERQEAITKQFGQLKKKNPKSEPLFIGRENLIKRISRKQAE